MPEIVHEPESAGDVWWCLRSALYYALVPARRVIRACGLGVHDWCSCCSPVSCRRCGKMGRD